MEVIKYDDLIKLPPEKRLREPSFNHVFRRFYSFFYTDKGV